jgi:rubrerythrin
MTDAVSALKLAIELEKQALEKYREALPHVTHAQTRQAVERYASEKNQQIDSLHWMIMAEEGTLETEEAPAAVEEEKPKAGKCPFSGALAEMGVDITKMGDMGKTGDMSKMAEMMKEMSPDEPKS